MVRSLVFAFPIVPSNHTWFDGRWCMNPFVRARHREMGRRWCLNALWIRDQAWRTSSFWAAHSGSVINECSPRSTSSRHFTALHLREPRALLRQSLQMYRTWLDG